MRAKFILTIIILFIPALVFSQSVKDAYKSLKKLQLQTETGINYKDYKNAFIDAKLEFEMFISAKGESPNLLLVKHLKRALQAYETANDIWTTEIQEKQRLQNSFGHSAFSNLMQTSSEEIGKQELKKYSETFPILDSPTIKTKDGKVYRQIAIMYLWKEASIEIELAHNELIGK